MLAKAVNVQRVTLAALVVDVHSSKRRQELWLLSLRR